MIIPVLTDAMQARTVFLQPIGLGFLLFFYILRTFLIFSTEVSFQGVCLNCKSYCVTHFCENIYCTFTLVAQFTVVLVHGFILGILNQYVNYDNSSVTKNNSSN